MSPKAADPALRAELIETAARLVAAEGRAGLTLRGLAREVGTSTMAIYTHFGGMDELRREVRREGFARLQQHLEAVKVTRDPVADLSLLGKAYYVSGIAAPNLYRAMFSDGPIDDVDFGTGLDSFMVLVNAVARCMDAGRLRLGEPPEHAVQFWALSHGVVSLQLAQLLPPEQALDCLESTAQNLLLAWGDDPKATARSVRNARRRLIR